MDLTKIEDKLDRVSAGAIPIAQDIGGIQFTQMSELFDFAKLMSLSGAAVPSHLRGNPGACLAICTRALRWKFDPFFVAEKSYLVNNRGEEKIAFEAQLLIAVINAHAPVEGRLRYSYKGQGDDRVCVVSGTPKGETEALTFETPTLGALKAARGTNDRGQLKGSPLYMSDPDQQLGYYAARGFSRRHFPEVLGGVYDKDELEGTHIGPDRAKDVTPKPGLKDRLQAKQGQRGFSAQHVERETNVSRDSGNKQSSGTGTAWEPAPVSTAKEVDHDAVVEKSVTANADMDTQAAGPSQAGQAGETPATESSAALPEPRGVTEPSVAPDGSAGDEGEDGRAPVGPVIPSSTTPTVGGGPEGGQTESSAALPPDWPQRYVSALKRVSQPDNLRKIAAQFWERNGGWPPATQGDMEKAKAIYALFDRRLVGKLAAKDMDAALREFTGA